MTTFRNPCDRRRNPDDDESSEFVSPGDWFVVDYDKDVLLQHSPGLREGRGFVSSILSIKKGEYIQYIGIAKTLKYRKTVMYHFVLVRGTDRISFYTNDPESVFEFTTMAEPTEMPWEDEDEEES